MKLTGFPSVDVVIPTFNSAADIDECLRRLRSQDYKGNVNIIIIDGGSTDGTIDICSKYGCEIHTCIGMYSNGLTGARNKAIEFCKGDLYWQIDSDNFVYNESTLKKLVEPFMAIDGIMITVPMISYSPEMSGIDKWLADYEKIAIKKMASKGTLEGNWVIVEDMTYGVTNASLLRTNMLRNVGGYDSDARVLARARKMGLSKGVIVIDTSYYHVSSGTYLRYLKKLSRRIVLYASFSNEELKNYFVPYSHDHSQRGKIFKSQTDYIIASIDMLRKKKAFWYWGIFLIFGYFLAFFIRPVSFIRTLTRFF